MKRTFVVAVLAASVGALVMFDAAAQARPDVLVKQRQAGMTLLGKYFGPLGGMAQGRVPYDVKTVQRNAAYLDVLKDMPWDGFQESTKGEKSAALPAVWEKSGEWKQAIDRSVAELEKLAAVSKNGDEGAVKAQIGAVGKTCGGCHDNFREKR